MRAGIKFEFRFPAPATSSLAPTTGRVRLGAADRRARWFFGICIDGSRVEITKQTLGDVAHEYLVIFQYHEPEARQLFERGVIEDYESTTGVFIAAESAEDALIWCEAIAREVLWHCNDDRSLDWTQLGYSCWIESDPRASSWSHCLDFFQHVRVGEMPNVEAMGTGAYIAWQKR